MIPKEIINDYSLKPYSIPKWYKGEADLQIGKFIYFFKDDKSRDIVFRVNIKNYANENVFESLLLQIDKQIEKIDLQTLAKTKLCKVENFDSLIFAPFKYTVIPKSDFPDFDAKQVMVFPAYCFEVAGNESPKDFNIILRKHLLAVDWNREPTPKVLYKFQNPKHKYGTAGKSFVIDKESNVYSALQKFETNDCFMDVKNTRDEEISIKFDKLKKIYPTTSGNKEQELNYDDLCQLLRDFLRKCN
jgi:hypothetical protein